MSESLEPEQIELAVVQLDQNLPLPSYAHQGDAGLDLYAAHSIELKPGARGLVATGIALELPPGYAGFIHPRSGLAARQGLSVVNTPGTIDAGYRGEIKVLLINHDQHSVVQLNRGDRIAQLVIQRVVTARLRPVASLTTSQRGAGGYGSSGGF